MSRSSAATTAGRQRTIPRTTTPPLPRRVSGPAGSPRQGADGHATALPSRRAPRPQRLAYGGVAIASRVAGVAIDVSASRAMDRLVSSRVWIGIVAFSLIGLVVVQVSLLKLNSGIGRAVQTTSTLERSNAALRADVSRLSAADRIQPLAQAQGLVMPAPADVSYLRAGNARTDALLAVRRMRGSGIAAATQAPVVPAGLASADGAAPTTVVPAGPAAATTAAGSAPAPPAAASTGTAAPAAPIAGGTASPSATAPAIAPAGGGAAPVGTSGSSGGAVVQQAIAATP